MLTRKVGDYVYANKSGDFNWPFEKVKYFYEDCDIRVANLESGN